MLAYFVAGGLALLASAFIGLTSKGDEKWDRKQIVGLATSVLLWLAGISWFATSRTSFVGNAHYTAAVLLFAVFIVIVVLSARGERHLPVTSVPERRAFTGAYGLIAAGMFVCLAIGLIFRSSAILAVETVLLVLFLLYWVLRTAEQWRAVTEKESADT
jgi:preprotein translocase subunit SecY